MKTLILFLFLNLSLYSQTVFKQYYNSNHQLQQTGYFTNNQLDSIWVQYNNRGDTIAVAHYHLGIKQGLWKWKQDTKTCILYYNKGEKIKLECE